MTQIVNVRNPSFPGGPRGIPARAAGGTYTQDCQQDIVDGDSFQGPITELSGTTDAICGVIDQATQRHAGGNFIIKTGQADAITLPAPTAGIDDGLTVNIWSDTAFVHTVTLPGAFFAVGTAAPKTIGTFTTGFRGQGIGLRAYNGTWQVVANSNVAFT